ncbi:MAG TPA: ABC transporter permease [Blastocatellia bacterium]|nr:ABC transporter permease [Blastocatellia bacterium]
MHTLLQDLRYTFRTMMRSPAFSLLVVSILALGIGANTAIFSFVNGVLLRPLPFPEPERLVTLAERNPEKARYLDIASPRNLEDWQKQSRTIEQFGAWRDWRFHISTPEGPKGVQAGIASPGLFSVLGVKPVAGRTFLPEEDQPGHNHVVLITHSYWQSQFGSDPHVINQPLTLDNESFTIVGVLPPEFETLGFGWVKVWAPLSVDPDQFLGRHVRNRRVWARLKTGVTLREAQAEMSGIAEQLAAAYPKENAGWSVSVTSLHESEVGDIGRTLMVFLGAVGFVLLIACANVANLLLARAATRRREFAIRAALGAGRWRIIRQALTESIVLALAGGALGLALAVWLIDLFLAISPDTIPRAGQVKLDTFVLAFTFALSLLTGALFGLAPGVQAARVNLIEVMKGGTRGSFSGLGFGLRSLLVVAQVALALVLLVGAGLLGRTFVQMMTLKPGYNPEHLLTVSVFSPYTRLKTGKDIAAFYQRVTEEIETIPGVRSVGVTSAGPQFGGFEDIEVLPEGQPASPSGDYPRARYYNVGPDYFHTLQVPVLKGREFTTRDNDSAPAVAVINETMARGFWPGENPVGKRLTLVREKDTVEIVGVVGDVRRYGLDDRVSPEIYWPYMQRVRGASYFAIRTGGEPSGLAAAVRSHILKVAPDASVSAISTMDQLVASSLRRPRFNLILLAIFAVTALLLAAAGLYGVMSYSVAERTREIGIRLALGAQRQNILRLVVGQGLVLTVAGVIIGQAGAFALTRLMTSLLSGVSATDPLTFVMIALLLTFVALLACYLPARRATKVDPMTALRHE